jgi:hypothetical protein
MKIKVEYIVPRVVVSKVIEVGEIRNNNLNDKQSEQVDELVKNVLRQKLTEKFKEIGSPIIKIKNHDQ